MAEITNIMLPPHQAGQVGGTGNYAELPLDADAFRRLESVLESEEAQQILGRPLLDMVTNPGQLGPFEDLDTSLFEGVFMAGVWVANTSIAVFIMESSIDSDMH